MTRTSEDRRQKLVRPRLQLRMIAAFAGVTLLALLAQFLVLGALLTETANTLPSGGPELAERIPALLGRAMIASLGLVLPALFLIGLRATFRVAGPVHRFEEHLRAVTRGEEPGPCRIRAGDHLQELCELINNALAAQYERGVTEAGGAVERGPAEALPDVERAA